MSGRRDIIAGATLLGFSALIYHKSGELGGMEAAGGLGPGSFPRALAVVVGALSAVLIAEGFLKKKREEEKPLFGPHAGRMVLFFAALAVYILMMPFAGYLVPTVLFLFGAMMVVMEKRTARAAAAGLLYCVVAAAAVYYVFGVFLDVPVIEGPVDEFFRYTVFRR